MPLPCQLGGGRDDGILCQAPQVKLLNAAGAPLARLQLEKNSEKWDGGVEQSPKYPCM